MNIADERIILLQVTTDTVIPVSSGRCRAPDFQFAQGKRHTLRQRK